MDDRVETFDGDQMVLIGEPGAYAVPGHLDDAAKIEMLHHIYEFDGELTGLTMPRETWMIVTDRDDDDEPGFDVFYREARERDPGAEPYTVVAVEGYWRSPDEVERDEWMVANERVAMKVARIDPIERGESTDRLGAWIYCCRFCDATAESRHGFLHRDGCEWLAAVTLHLGRRARV